MRPLYCSFCGKHGDEVHKLIAGPTVFICNECVCLCIDIIAENPYPPQMRAGDLGLPEPKVCGCSCHRKGLLELKGAP